MWRSTSACIASLALLGSCGSLVDGNYRGEPLYTVSGSVFVDPDDPEATWPDAPLRVSVFWAGASGLTRVEQAVVVETEFPARYQLSIYRPPPEGVRFDTPWYDGRVAIGVPMLYLDHNGDEQWNADEEPLTGGSFDLAIVYAEDGETNIASFDLKGGYQSMWVESTPCDDRIPIGTEFFPAPGAPMDLFVGDYWRYMQDWDCDGSYTEWQDACPPESEMEMICSEPGLIDDPFLEECAWEWC